MWKRSHDLWTKHVQNMRTTTTSLHTSTTIAIYILQTSLPRLIMWMIGEKNTGPKERIQLIKMCSMAWWADSLMNENKFYAVRWGILMYVRLEVGGRRNFLFTFNHRHETASREHFHSRFKSFAGNMSEK